MGFTWTEVFQPAALPVMQTLRFRLAMLGVPHDFIMRIKTSEVKGYSIKKNMVRPLYLLTEDA